MMYIYKLNDKVYEVEADNPKQAYKIASDLYGKNGNVWEKQGYIEAILKNI